MTTGRTAGAIGAAFLVSQVIEVIVHGFLLGADYEPFRGTLLRNGGWQMVFLPLVHLSYIAALVWVYGRAVLGGGVLSQGVKLGLFAWFVGQVPLWLLWYAEQPWPGHLVVKQLVLELVSAVIIGLTIAAVGGGHRAATPDVTRSARV